MYVYIGMHYVIVLGHALVGAKLLVNVNLHVRSNNYYKVTCTGSVNVPMIVLLAIYLYTRHIT